MNYYIGADLGTSALKMLLVDEKGNILNSVTKTGVRFCCLDEFLLI